MKPKFNMDGICRELGNDLSRLVRPTGPWERDEWNDFLEERLALPRRKSYEAILNELNGHFGYKAQHDANSNVSSNAEDDSENDNRHPAPNAAHGIIQRNGAWSLIERLFRQSPSQADLIWITYNFATPREAIEFLVRRAIKARVLCRHPRSGVALSRTSFDAWHKRGIGPILGLKVREGEDEEEVPGALHAKAIPSRSQHVRQGFSHGVQVAVDERQLAYTCRLMRPTRQRPRWTPSGGQSHAPG